MEAKRQMVMVKSVAKNIRAKEREQAKIDKIRNKACEALGRAGKAIDEVTKSELSKKDYEAIIKYLQEVRKCPISLFPNLM